MAKIYQLMTGKKQIGDVYYDGHDAIENAKQLVRDTGMTVSVLEAEEISDVPYDVLEWTTLTTIPFYSR